MRWVALALALFYLPPGTEAAEANATMPRGNAPKSGSMPIHGVPPRKGKLGTEPTKRERLGTDPAAPANRRPVRPDG
jgi:hypothetical protein